jgi:organic radical activating enzyme
MKMMKMMNMNKTLRFAGINKDTTTAGPGKRLEFFTKGCIRGVISPCIGCFNEATWTFEGKSRQLTINEVVDICVEDAWNRQVTFCGGEPILQARALAQVAKRLKIVDPTFHFVMYTAYKLDTLMKYGLKFTWVPKYGLAMLNHLQNYADSPVGDFDEENMPDKVEFTILSPEDVKELMNYIDIIVDGDYQQDKRLTTEKYMHDGWFIGSSNQRVVCCKKTIENGRFEYIDAFTYNELRGMNPNCKCCGKTSRKLIQGFCGDLCKDRYEIRKHEMSLIEGK